MSETGLAVGIVGVGVVAQQIAASLVERAFPFASLRFLGDASLLGEGVEVDERTFPVEPLEAAGAGLDLVFLTGESEWQERDAESLVLAGATVIDCSGRYAREADVPLVVPECNAHTLADADRRIIASPDPVAVALCVVLAPLRSEAGVRRVVATSLESVSQAGSAGIEELSRQAVELLQGQSTENDVFPARICFNVLPRIGETAPSGDSVSEEQACWQVRRVLEDADLAIAVTRLNVPVFYGTGIVVNVELETPMDADAARELLRGAPGILSTAPEDEADLSLSDAVGQDATLVGRVRADRSAENAITFWVAIDNARKGSAVNAVQIAEIVMKE